METWEGRGRGLVDGVRGGWDAASWENSLVWDAIKYGGILASA